LKNSIKYFGFILLFAFVGFSREFLFVNINAQLFTLFYKNTDYVLPSIIRILSNFDYQTLYYFQYLLTVIYFFAYFFTTYFAVKYICIHKKNTLWVTYIYLLLLALSTLSMGYNFLINNQLGGNEYTFSRWLMGIAQSPLVCFFIIASSKLYNKFQTQQ
jgi:hypothetical protein